MKIEEGELCLCVYCSLIVSVRGCLPSFPPPPLYREVVVVVVDFEVLVYSLEGRKRIERERVEEVCVG